MSCDYSNNLEETGDKEIREELVKVEDGYVTTYFPHSVDHGEVSQAHGPEQVEHLGDASVGRHCVGTRVHVGGDILGTQRNSPSTFNRPRIVFKCDLVFESFQPLSCGGSAGPGPSRGCQGTAGSPPSALHRTTWAEWRSVVDGLRRRRSGGCTVPL